jgi:Secretion system C-terminal sorting domain
MINRMLFFASYYLSLMKSHLLTLVCLVASTILNAQSNLPSNWRFYRPGNTGIQGDNAYALWVDENGDPYIAANTGNWGEGGFAKFDQATNKWINYSNVDLPILGGFDNGDIHIEDIIEDYDHNLWMAKMTGAIKFNPSIGASSIENFDSSNSELLGYSSDADLAPDSSIWFISGGLVRYRPQNNEWTYVGGASARVSVQPKPDGSYIVWSADIYYGYVFQYNSATDVLTTTTPELLGDVAGLPGKDCVDDEGNFWALRMAENGDWETLEYQRPNGEWVHPVHPYDNVTFYINEFRAYGDQQALLILNNGEAWMFDGTDWHNYGTWRPGDYNMGIDTDAQGNVWVCGIEGAAKRDVNTGEWQRYRITNTAQIDYMVEDLTVSSNGDIWFTGNGATGIGGIQKFDGERWSGFNPYTYGLGQDFPFDADNATAIADRPSQNSIAFSPTFHGVYTWDGDAYNTIESEMTTSKGLVEDSEGRLWNMGEYYSYRYYNDNTSEWTTMPIVGSGLKIIKDPTLSGTVWAMTDYEIQRTNGVDVLSIDGSDFPGSAAWLTGLAVESDGTVWTGTWAQFTSSGSTLIKYNPQTGEQTVWSYDEGWPFPGEHVRPMAVTPDGRIWMIYDSEYPSLETGIFAYDGVNIDIYPSAPGGFPAWDMLPNSNVKDVEVKIIDGGYELWMSCLGRGIAVLTILDEAISVNEFNANSNALEIFAFPNPASDKTTIQFTNPVAGPTNVSVYDITGRKVVELCNRNMGQGLQTITWNFASDNGSVTPGMYFIKVITPQGEATTRIQRF